MTGPAQHHLIIGAVCIDDQFRTELFAAVGAGETDQDRIAKLLTAYGQKWDCQFNDPKLVDDIVGLVRGNCRVHVLEKATDLHTAACPCWPC